MTHQRLPWGVFCLLFVLASSARAEVVSTRIQTVITPESGEKNYLVFSTVDGRVYDVDSEDLSIVDRLSDAQNRNEDVRLILDGDRVIAVAAIPSAEISNEKEPMAREDVERDSAFSLDSWRSKEGIVDSYAPSVLSSLTEARNLYASLERLRRSSQCYQRAHYWSYSMWRKQSVKSLKVFLFFTQSYIKRYKYKWWFHVAPFVLVGDKEIVLDPSFTDDALEMRSWTDNFMKSKVECGTVTSYSDYERNQFSADCYLRKVPMYYYQPLNIETRDSGGEVVTFFREKELKHAERAKPWF